VKLILILLIGCGPVLGQGMSTSTMQVKPLPILPKKNNTISNFLSGFPEFERLPVEVRDWFYWTNYSRQFPKAFWDSVVSPLLKVYPHFNTKYARTLQIELYRTSGLGLIKPNATLLGLAQRHAKDLAQAMPGRISHNSSNGTPFEQRMGRANIQNCAAENLSLGPSNTVLSLVLLYLDEGLPDVGHRRNLLSPYYVEMGIGSAPARDGATVVVQDFACKQN
jgi:hypothetical protein